MVKLPMFSSDRISTAIFRHSASGNIGSYWPAMSKSCTALTSNLISDQCTQLLLTCKLLWSHLHLTAVAILTNVTTKQKYDMLSFTSVTKLFSILYNIHMILKKKTYTLIKFSESTSRHGRIVTSIYFSNMVSFHCINFVHCQVPSKRHLSVC